MIILFGIIYFLAVCSVVYALLPSNCCKRIWQIIKHINTLKDIKKKGYKSISQEN